MPFQIDIRTRPPGIKVRRIPERQARQLKGQIPPLAAALTYRDLIWSALDRFNAQILETILADWSQNPAHISGTTRGDAIQSSFVTTKIGALDVGVEELIDPAMVSKLGYVAERVNAHGVSEFKRVIGISTHDMGIGGALNSFRDRNVDLIKSLARNQLTDVRDVLATAEAGAWQTDELRKELQTRFGVTKSKADLLARDQTLKLNGQLTMTRQRNAGIKKYIWTTSRDERVRPMHEELDGTIQDWDAPPVVSDDGRRCHPGDDYQCRCTPFPVLEELDEELDPEFAPDAQPEEVLGFHPLDRGVTIPGSRSASSLFQGVNVPRAVPDPVSVPAPGPTLFAPEPDRLAVFQFPGGIDQIGGAPAQFQGFALTKPAVQGSLVKPPPLGVKPEILVPKDIQRSGFAGTFQKVSAGVSDLDLDYLRNPESFRSLEPFNKRYEDLLKQGLSPTDIALKEPYPIKINVQPDGTMSLRDGRHRWTTARKYGATMIEAEVTQYGPKGGIRWQKTMRIPIKGP